MENGRRHAALRWRQATIVLAALFVVYTVVHFGRGGVYLPLIHHGMVQTEMEMRPLRAYFLKGRPVSPGNFRQYGPTFLFVLHPFLKWTAGPDPGNINLVEIDDNVVRLSRSLYVLEIVSSVLACWFVVASLRLWMDRLPRGPATRAVPYVVGAIVLLWMNFTPLYEVIDVKTVEPWELCLLSGALYAHLRGHSFWTGFCVAAASLMKWLPGFFFLYLLLRDRRAFGYACASVLGLLLVSHAIYGPEMGLLYPLLPLKASGGATTGFLGHASFSFKSLIAKALGEFQIPGGPILPPPVPDFAPGFDVMISPERMRVANILGNLCSLLFIGWTVYLLVARPRTGNRTYDILWDWSLVTAVMFVVPPVSSYEYATLVLPAFSFVAAMLAIETWDRRHAIAAAFFAVSLLLVGNIVPRTLVMRLVLVGPISRWAGPPHFTLDQKYYSFGFPLYGVLLLIVALWLLRPVRAHDVARGAAV